MIKPGRLPSQRQLRVGEVVRHALSEVFSRGETRISDIDQAGLTVLEVTVSADLKNATAYVMPLGGSNATEVMSALDKWRKRVRGLLAKKINLKYTPDIVFRLDDTLEYAGKIDQLLNSPTVAQDVSGSKTDPAE